VPGRLDAVLRTGAQVRAALCPLLRQRLSVGTVLGGWPR
jgi:hypothetical protein